MNKGKKMRNNIERDKDLQRVFVKGVKETWATYEHKRDITYDDIEVTPIASNSHGNCFVLNNKTQRKRWIYDLGVNLSQVRQKTTIGDISKIFITHHHNDHNSGLESAMSEIPHSYFVTPETIKELEKYPTLGEGNDYLSYKLEHTNANMTPIDTYAYIYGGVLYMTDFGTPPSGFVAWIVRNIDDIHFVIMEANYCKHEMWDNPTPNMDRLTSNSGHLSWSEAFYLLYEINKELIEQTKPIISNEGVNNIHFMTMHLNTGARKGYGDDCPFDLKAYNELDSKTLFG